MALLIIPSNIYFSQHFNQLVKERKILNSKLTHFKLPYAYINSNSIKNY